MPRTDEWDECLCCGDQFLEAQISEAGFCTMCQEARRSYNQDGIPGGRPCCRKKLSELRKLGEKA